MLWNLGEQQVEILESVYYVCFCSFHQTIQDRTYFCPIRRFDQYEIFTAAGKRTDCLFGVVVIHHIRNKYRMLKSVAKKAEGKIIILDMICFEYLILSFDKLVAWTGTGKTDKLKIYEDVLAAVEDHRINLSKVDDEKTLRYLSSFKRYSTERVMKSLVGEFTQNEKWSVKGLLMGECWYKNCCVSEHQNSLRCGKPEIKDGSEKMRVLMQSKEIEKILITIAR